MPTYTKDPSARLDYQYDWSSWLEDGETISAATWDTPDGIDVYDQDNTTTTATVWLEGGTVGQTYDVVNQITTSAGRIDQRTIRIRVNER